VDVPIIESANCTAAHWWPAQQHLDRKAVARAVFVAVSLVSACSGCLDRHSGKVGAPIEHLLHKCLLQFSVEVLDVCSEGV